MTNTSAQTISNVFDTGLDTGVAALARAIGLRQAKDMLYVSETESVRDGSVDSQNAHIFPAGDCASAIMALCTQVQETLSINMEPIAELVRDFTDRPIRECWPTTHEWLSVLADLTHGYHLVPTMVYTAEEKLAVKRLFAVIHLALCGPLPKGNWGARDGREIVGCPKCISERKVSAHAYLCHLLAEATAWGELDATYTRLKMPDGYKFGDDVIDDRKRIVRLSWKVESNSLELEADMIAELRQLGFDAAEHHGWGIMIHAQKPLTGDISAAMNWGSQRFARYGSDVTWYGVEIVSSPERGPND